MQISTYIVDRVLENGCFLKEVGPNHWTAISKRAARIKVAQCMQYQKRKLRALSASTNSRRIADSDNNDDDDAADFVAHTMYADEEANEGDLYHMDQMGTDHDHDFQYTTTAMCKIGSCHEESMCMSLKDLLGKSGPIFPVRSDLLGNPVTFQTTHGCYKVNGENGGTGVRFSATETLDKLISSALEAVENDLLMGGAWT